MRVRAVGKGGCTECSGSPPGLREFRLAEKNLMSGLRKRGRSLKLWIPIGDVEMGDLGQGRARPSWRGELGDE